MSASWLTEQQADRLLTLACDMAELITCLAEDIDDGYRPPGSDGETSASAPERALLERFDSLYREIDASGTYPAGRNDQERTP